MKIPLMIFLSVCCIKTAIAADVAREIPGSQWFYIGGDNGYSMTLLDRKRVIKTDEHAGSYVVRTVTLKPYATDSGAFYSDAVEHYHADCLRKIVYLDGWALYQADGTLIKKENTRSNELPFPDRTVDGSHAAYDILCQGEELPSFTQKNLLVTRDSIQDFMKGIRQ